MKIIICIYVVISLGVGIVDVLKLKSQEEELSTFPRGDVGVNIVPKKILGIHNLIFFPSFLILGTVYLVNLTINKLKGL